jgi:hypothetical protein
MSNITAECITSDLYRLNKEIKCYIDLGNKGQYGCHCSVMLQEKDVCFVRIKSTPNLLKYLREEDPFKLKVGTTVICEGKVIEIY